MKNKLSNSALNTYNTCGRKYFYHYSKRLRSKYISGALIMGGAIDKGLNELLTHHGKKLKDGEALKKAIEVFESEFTDSFINNVKTYIPTSTQIVYAKKDFDRELIDDEDEIIVRTYHIRFSEAQPDLTIYQIYEQILKQKEEKGFETLSNSDKGFYNLFNWLCLKKKGRLMLQAYHDKVLPKIKKVIAVQKEFNLKGKSGDVLNGFIDLIVEWEDGKKYVLDNKTSTMEYEPDSASKSQQLILYYYVSNKELPPEEKLDGAGFIVLYKQIQKNRIKICEKCGNNGTGGRHKTCDKMIIGGDEQQRCNGAWKETIRPECRVEIILNPIAPQAQNLVLQTFLGANEGIKKGHFGPNLDSCHKFGQPCQYINLCWKGEDKELIQLEEKKND